MNSLVSIAYKAIWLVAIFALIAMGLMPFGINLYNNALMLQHPWLMDLIAYIAGIAGLLGLLKFVRALTGHSHSWCGCSSNNGKQSECCK